jgi:hypothetical protein
MDKGLPEEDHREQQHRQPDARDGDAHHRKHGGIKVGPKVEVAGCSPSRLHVNQRDLNQQACSEHPIEPTTDEGPNGRGRDEKGKTPGSDHRGKREFCRLKPCRRSGNHTVVDNQT